MNALLSHQLLLRILSSRCRSKLDTGDKLGTGTDNADGDGDGDGGAIFKFIPSGTTGGILNNLAASPLTAGSVYAMQTSCCDSQQQYGQGCEIGNAAWLPVSAEDARPDADALGATGYYRPEDLHKDPVYAGEGVWFCWANTGNEGASNYGEVICGIDSMPAFADADTRTVIINRFVEGDPQFNAMDSTYRDSHRKIRSHLLEFQYIFSITDGISDIYWPVFMHN